MRVGIFGQLIIIKFLCVFLRFWNGRICAVNETDHDLPSKVENIAYRDIFNYYIKYGTFKVQAQKGVDMYKFNDENAFIEYVKQNNYLYNDENYPIFKFNHYKRSISLVRAEHVIKSISSICAEDISYYHIPDITEFNKFIEKMDQQYKYIEYKYYENRTDERHGTKSMSYRKLLSILCELFESETSVYTRNVIQDVHEENIKSIKEEIKQLKLKDDQRAKEDSRREKRILKARQDKLNKKEKELNKKEKELNNKEKELQQTQKNHDSEMNKRERCIIDQVKKLNEREQQFNQIERDFYKKQQQLDEERRKEEENF